jgi:signal peptidase II
MTPNLCFMTQSRALRLLAVFVVLVFTAGCDQATKHLARSDFSQRSATLAGGLIEFTLAENPGAFMNLGASLPEAARGGLLTGGVSVGLAFLLAYLLRNSKLHRLAFLGLSLIWAGGTSNLLDRFYRHGVVTDFMVLRAGSLHTGVFNVADMAVVLGLVLVIASLASRPTPERSY